ncbi:MAG: diacylglycerol/lipid kinase family protein [Rubrobacteraceae bacterium]
MDVVIIGNPASGRGDMNSLKRCAGPFKELGGEVEVWPTERPEHATELATLAGACMVVAAGGDGTVNEVINGLHTDATLGILPTGTANVLARELGLPLDVDKACRRIVEGKIIRMDLGIARDEAGVERKFSCMAGIGFDANVVRSVPDTLKKNLGAMAFALTAFKVLAVEDLPWIRIENGGDHTSQFAIIANGQYYGGDYRSSELASLTNGELDVIMVEKVSKLLRPDIFGRILAKKPLSKDATRFSATELEATSEEKVPVQLDGEIWGRLPMTFRVEPASLKVIR